MQHNETGSPAAAASALIALFGDEVEASRTASDDLVANFADKDAQGPKAYSEQMLIDHPSPDQTTVVADAILSVEEFYDGIFGSS
jgi:hypothetical protein